MTTNPDAISDALVAALTAAAPAGVQVVDHEALPFRLEDLPAAGIFGVFLFQDAPFTDDGSTNSAGIHQRQATFKVEIRVPGSAHLLHGTQAMRRVIAKAIKADPQLGMTAMDTRLGAMAVLVHEQSSAVACAALDVHVDYLFDPENA
jgi:hypothetical protein